LLLPLFRASSNSLHRIRKKAIWILKIYLRTIKIRPSCWLTGYHTLYLS
jgi:hypothetical protein